MKSQRMSVLRHNIERLLLHPTNNSALQFIRYIFVGGLATVVDWTTMFVFTEYCHVHYLLSAAVAFATGLLTNFILSKVLVFKACERRYSACFEFLGYAIIGLVGLGFTELILYVMTSHLNIHYMIAKITASFIVLFWNYFARKICLYKPHS